MQNYLFRMQDNAEFQDFREIKAYDIERALELIYEAFYMYCNYQKNKINDNIIILQDKVVYYFVCV